ncbi:MAG: enoyl-CoA hydratase-related protein [Pseudomonadota bacterium]
MTSSPAPDFESFTYSVEEGVAHLAFSRPEIRNAMTRVFWREFPAALSAAEADASVRTLVISSTGPHFCAGLDTSIFTEGADFAQTTPHERLRLMDWLGQTLDVLQRLERLRFPVIAAIQGGCIGGGVDLASACDIRIAAADAFFRIEEINVGMMADLGTLQRLPKILPEAVARELAYTGANLSAERAERLGYVNQIAADGDAARQAALEMAAQIAAKAPLAITGSKHMITYARDHTVREALEHMRAYQAAIFEPGDVMESYGAKMEKRAPKFANLPTPAPAWAEKA